MKRPMIWIATLAFFVTISGAEEDSSTSSFTLEGKVSIPHSPDLDWVTSTRILVDGGKYIGFLKEDGSFVVTNVPPGSYVVEVASPDYVFDPARVDITSRGRMRARRVNNLQPFQSRPSSGEVLTYPLRLKAKAPTQYFLQREEWRITDVVKNPMVMMMILPVILIGILPKLMNSQDPEVQREMQQSMNVLQPGSQNLPDVAEWMTSLFDGGSSAERKRKSEKSGAAVETRRSARNKR